MIEQYLKVKEKTSDDQVKMFIDFLRNCVSFSYARFNDGEMGGIQRVGASIARGDQIVNNSLHDKLIECIKHEQKNYFVGMPCSICFPDMRKTADSLVREDYEYKVRATAFTNRNWLYFIQNFSDALGSRKMIWICGDDQDTSFFSDYGVDLESIIYLPRIDSWSQYDKIKNYVTEISDGSVIGLSCGPLSRILAKEWFEKNCSLTLLDLGCTFDPFTRGVSHNCHKGWLENSCNVGKPCPECN